MRCSLPGKRTVSGLYLDLTQACNLDCVYCFKGQKNTRYMSESLARNAIDWLLDASGDSNDSLRVSLMGGEPLLCFDLIQQIVPYAKCRARQRGKTIGLGATTNCTLVTDEIVAFWGKHDMLFHCSIDGIPEAQNANRPMLSGQASSPAVETNARKIIAFQPGVWARATVTPTSVPFLAQSAEYFAKLGFRVMSFQPAVNSDWQPKDIEVLREQYHKLGRFYLDRLISGSLVSIDEFRKGLALLHSLQSNTRTPCSAGCADVMIDPVGDIYPCTRFGPHLCGGQFRLGSIGESFNDRLREVFLNYNIPEDVRADCLGCRARSTCRDWCNAACAELTLSLYDPGTTFCEAKRALHDEILEIDDYLRCHHPDLLDGVIQGRTNV